MPPIRHDMLVDVNLYLQQAKWLKEQADNAGDGGQTDRSVAKFEPKNDDERKTYEELRELFEHFDADGSGELGKEEVTHKPQPRNPKPETRNEARERHARSFK